jgi:hypothetical protein
VRAERPARRGREFLSSSNLESKIAKNGIHPQYPYENG